ncbi:hypothetical protein KEM09_15260 [Carboxylicivirga mesophila]|uniref:Uncharacterized protein n=1 Tax=Carboxylicivirga mesophila TaxID=1166478 RepID=A0ABS5KD79_9BACT|nr:hypothetical protein [Carboxylicivirga mesophila]MBS2212777.1 hypothetical protein [Carboxylicivirga mesophila]
MSIESIIEQWQPILASIPREDIKKPKIPVKHLCVEAEALAVTCLKDKEQLVKAGLNWQHAMDLKPLSELLRHYQSQWQSTRGQSPQTKQWLAMKQEAIALKKELLRHYYYAFHHHPAILKQLKPISHSNKNNQLNIHLLELANIADKHGTVLSGINFDTNQSTRARELANQLAEHLAKNHNASPSGKDALLWRNRTYTLLYNKMTGIRTCGKYAFYHNSRKRKLYMSSYFAKSKKNGRPT